MGSQHEVVDPMTVPLSAFLGEGGGQEETNIVSDSPMAITGPDDSFIGRMNYIISGTQHKRKIKETHI